MFAPQGYEPLANLWKWFEARFGSWCRAKAIEFYSNPEIYTPADIFGSPRDLCEDLFLRSLENFEITLASVDAPSVEVTPVLSNSAARLFEKATPLESFHIAMFPDEAGPENEWLLRMGSAQFVPSGHTDAEVNDWLQTRYCEDKRDERLHDPKIFAFHTLPYLFERGSFIFPSELPPWTIDMLEAAFARTLKDACGGRSMCLSNKSAAGWRQSVSEVNLAHLLESSAPIFENTGKTAERLPAGRPRKMDRVIAALQAMRLNKRDLSRKEILRKLDEDLGEAVSPSTLDRALKAMNKGQVDN